jgi:site-specific DNA recombinase
MPPQTDPGKPLRAIIYARQSKDKKDGIDRQVEKCLKLIADRGWELVHAPFCDNDVSASNKTRKRPAYEQAMSMVRTNQCDVLVVTHMDRLYRRLAELEDIIPVVEQTGVIVVSIDGSYDLSTDTGRLVARVLAATAQGEVETKARRNKDRNVQLAGRGERNKSGCRPFGYAENRIDPQEPEAQAVRDAIDSVLRGGSITGITRRWGEQGFRPPLAPFGPLPEGNPWSHHTVRRILTNAHIAGLRSYNGVIVATGNWVPLVTVEKWEAAMAILTDPARTKPRGALSLLGGIAECRCGEEVNHATRPQRGTTVGYGTYRCSAFKQEDAARTGPHVCVKAAWIDRYVTDVLLETMERPDAAKAFARDENIDVPGLREELKMLDDALANLSWQNAVKAIPDQIFLSNSARVNAEREKISMQIAEAGKVNAAAALLTAFDVRAEWDRMNINERRAVIRSLMHVTLRPVGSGCRRPDFNQLVRIAWLA